jgi:hypothetical protein
MVSSSKSSLFDARSSQRVSPGKRQESLKIPSADTAQRSERFINREFAAEHYTAFL